MSHDDDVGFLYKTMIERDPKKRRVKPVESAQTSLLDFDLGESSDDSDFRIEDHCNESDDDSVDSNDEGKDDDDDDDDDSDSDDSDDSVKDKVSEKKNGAATTVEDLVEKARQQAEKTGPMEDKLAKMLICCGCLGDRSDDVNEIVECDGCGVTVHEGCYGVSDVESFSSADSLSQSAPWFCEACSAGVEDPCCELCPNKGGIFKETDVGKWVHLVCALYVPGVAFGEVDRLTSVTLFEMQYNKWGAKACTLCEDVRFARTGVCIECDAGMCHTYFHVTCAQREGLLSEAHSEEVDQADPFYAHCKLHSDKTLVRKRKRNWLALQLRASYRQQMLKKPEYRDTEEFRRIQRKLAKHRQKYLAHKATKPPPWVPTQKMPRLLTTSATACRALQRKAELMGVNTIALENQEEQISSLVDIRKKWHISPAFSVEFISYFIDRIARTTDMKTRLKELIEANSRLLGEQQELDKKYDEAMRLNEEQGHIYDERREKIEMYHRVLRAANYAKPLPSVNDIAKPKPPAPVVAGTSTPSIVALKTAAAASSSAVKTETHRTPNTHHQQQQPHATTLPEQNHKVELQLRHQCGICRRSTNQHLLAKCDTCHLHYHLSCLTPPLTRMPKKTKLMGWQCSECDKETSGSDVERVDTSAPRRLRHCKDDSSSHSLAPPTPTPPQPTPSTPTPAPVTPTASHQNSMTIVEEALVHKPPPMANSTPLKSSPGQLAKRQQLQQQHHLQLQQQLQMQQQNSIVTIKPMVPQPKEPEPMQVDEVNYNHHGVNNSVPREGTPEYRMAPLDGIVEHTSGRSGKKRRREKHKRYTPDPITGVKQRKRKHKRKSLDAENPENHGPPEVHRRITIKIKPIPLPEGEVPSDSHPQLFVASSTSTEITPPKPKLHPLPPPAPTPSTSQLPGSTIPVVLNTPPVTTSTTNRGSTGGRKSKDADLVSQCTVCSTIGTNQNSVICDECKKCYHFTCLDPPVKKSPKRRGYSWHCADCDPSASEPEN
ncbi:PHD finger protein 14 isoform X2 [Nasonia vitripennis]|uniref:PHD finger protein 14 n=1 Tax=Nasonia vitripennis TaxID=7425 RepID=A0A7M7LN99_NASVI|nr:PHD finger protein 14 isoform X2 [Nasonia vitripennis]